MCKCELGDGFCGREAVYSLFIKDNDTVTMYSCEKHIKPFEKDNHYEITKFEG